MVILPVHPGHQNENFIHQLVDESSLWVHLVDVDDIVGLGWHHRILHHSWIFILLLHPLVLFSLNSLFSSSLPPNKQNTGSSCPGKSSSSCCSADQPSCHWAAVKKVILQLLLPTQICQAVTEQLYWECPPAAAPHADLPSKLSLTSCPEKSPPPAAAPHADLPSCHWPVVLGKSSSCRSVNLALSSYRPGPAVTWWVEPEAASMVTAAKENIYLLPVLGVSFHWCWLINTLNYFQDIRIDWAADR